MPLSARELLLSDLQPISRFLCQKFQHLQVTRFWSPELNVCFGGTLLRELNCGLKEIQACTQTVGESCSCEQRVDWELNALYGKIVKRQSRRGVWAVRGLAGPSGEQGRLQRMKGREREVCLARFQFPCLCVHFGNSLSSDTGVLFCLVRSSSSRDSRGSCLHPAQHLFRPFCRRITSPLRTEAKKGSTKLWIFNIDSAVAFLDY